MRGDRGIAMLRLMAERTRQNGLIRKADAEFATDASIIVYEDDTRELLKEKYEDTPKGFAEWCDAMADVLAEWQKE